MSRYLLITSIISLFVILPAEAALPYDIVYVRAPRHGDDKNTRWPEVKDPILMEPGADLILLHPDGNEEVLVAGGKGAIVDPYISFDGQWVYFAKFHDQTKPALNYQRRNASRAGSDIYRIHIKSRKVVRLTNQEWTPNTGAANWADHPVNSKDRSKNRLGYGVFNLGPCPLPGGKVMFTSSRNGFLPNKSYTFPNLQLFVMDDDGSNVELIGHMNLGSALHPTILKDGRVMFSSYEAQGFRDQRLWGMWAIWPDGRRWEPLMSAFEPATAFHFMTQLSDGKLVIEDYYNQNNNGFGSFIMFPPGAPKNTPPWGDPNPRHESNTRIHQGWHGNGKPRMESYSFSPYGVEALTIFTHGRDNASPRDPKTKKWMGKVTHPSGAPNNDLLLVWSPGPANDLGRPTPRPYYDGGLYRLTGGKPVDHPDKLELIKNDSRYNEMQPRAVVSYKDIYGVNEPVELAWLPNDGSESKHLSTGTPFGLVGTSSFYKRNTSPGLGSKEFDGLDPFNTSQNGASSNWRTQGADAGKYSDEDIWAVRVIALEPTTHRSYGPNSGRQYINHADERMRILGEIPLRKFDNAGKPIMDTEGNPDTSFLARIPADVPFTFQTLDRNGLVLNMSQTWHQVRPGEVRTDCGGCHAHAQVGLDFSLTAAAKNDFDITDVVHTTPLLTGNGKVKIVKSGAVDVEYYRDIKPILQRSCVQCHTGKEGKKPAAELVLDDDKPVNGYDGTWRRLADDARAKFGRKPVIKNGSWRQSNASRYVRQFQARRSLLVWKVFGKRLDGWTNDDHPTEKVPGDPSTLGKGVNPNSADIDFDGVICPPPGSKAPALSIDEKMTFARWVDLGCPINKPGQDYGWFLDDLRPTLTLSSPRAGDLREPVNVIRIGAFDYYSGLDANSLSVKADFAVNGKPAGAELQTLFKKKTDHVWELKLDRAISRIGKSRIDVLIKDRQGNLTELNRTFRVSARALTKQTR